MVKVIASVKVAEAIIGLWEKSLVLSTQTIYKGQGIKSSWEKDAAYKRTEYLLVTQSLIRSYKILTILFMSFPIYLFYNRNIAFFENCVYIFIIR